MSGLTASSIDTWSRHDMKAMHDIAVKRQGIWKIGHFQNTVIAPRFENDDLPD